VVVCIVVACLVSGWLAWFSEVVKGRKEWHFGCVGGVSFVAHM